MRFIKKQSIRTEVADTLMPTEPKSNNTLCSIQTEADTHMQQPYITRQVV